jgi:hypothetical protein
MKLRLCPSGKFSYVLEADARRSLAVYGSGPGAYKPRRAYQCPRCGMWHLTSWGGGVHGRMVIPRAAA